MRSEASTAASARCAASSSPTPTRAPPARITAASALTRSCTPWTAASDATQHPAVDDPVDVLAHLQRDAERGLEVAVAVERQQRARPRDRLPHPGQLVELLRAQPGDRLADPLGDRLGHAGQPRAHDLGLARRARIVDPVVEAAALERVVQLARA